MSAPASSRKSWVFATRCVEMPEMAVVRAVNLVSCRCLGVVHGAQTRAVFGVAATVPAGQVAVQYRTGSSILCILHNACCQREGEAEIRVAEVPLGRLLQPGDAVGDRVAVHAESRGRLPERGRTEHGSQGGQPL